MHADSLVEAAKGLIRVRGYKTFFMLNSAEHEIVPAQKR